VPVGLEALSEGSVKASTSILTFLFDVSFSVFLVGLLFVTASIVGRCVPIILPTVTLHVCVPDVFYFHSSDCDKIKPTCCRLTMERSLCIVT